MRFPVLVSSAVCCSLWAAGGLADDARQPEYVRRATLRYDFYQPDRPVEPSPSDLPVAPQLSESPTQSAPSESKGVCDCGGKATKSSCSCYLFGPDEAWELWPRDECTGVKVGGWLQGGYHSYNTGMFNDYPDTVSLQQAWIYAEKEADGSCGWDWGYRFDYVYGTDAPDTQAFGNPINTWDFGWFNGGFYGHAFPQLYADLAYQDLSIRLGHFYTIAGYEVVPATGNFFYSHAFTMYYAEPFTHTGALATYTMNDNVELYGGWTKGWDTGFEANGGDSFLGGFSLALTDNVTFIYTNTFGKIGFASTATGYSHSILFDVQLTERTNYVFQTDYIDYNGVDVADPTIDIFANRYGINQYLFYEINECLAFGVRAEWFNAKLDIGDRADLYELTAGINYRPHANIVLRPEVRYDKDDDGFTVDPSNNDSVGFGMDMIVTW